MFESIHCIFFYMFFVVSLSIVSLVLVFWGDVLEWTVQIYIDAF